MDTSLLTIHSDNTFAKIALQHLIDEIDFKPSLNNPIDIFYFCQRNITNSDIININPGERYIIIGHQHVLNCFSSINEGVNHLLIDILLGTDEVKTELIKCLHTLSRSSSQFVPAFKLTAKELSIVKNIAKGLPIPLIARMKNISVKTISTHKRSAMRKMDAKSTQIMLVKYKIYQNAQMKNSTIELNAA